ncbi:MAG: hypothetical protein RIC95_10540 [Vicingaceae bacterium]
MSFLDSIFNSDKLSDQAQVKFDLASMYLQNGQLLQASKAINEAEELEPDSEKVKALKIEIEESFDKIPEDDFDVEEVSDDPIDESQEWFILRMEVFEQEKVQTYTQAGYRVESVAYGDNQWVMVLRKSVNVENTQEYVLVEEFGEALFTEYFEDGYFIEQGVSDGTDWFFVLELREDWLDQFWIVSPNEFPKQEIETWEENGYFLNLLFEQNQTYFACAAESKQEMPQLTSNHTDEDPNEFVGLLWKNGQWLIRLFYSKSNFIFYHREDPTILDQSLLVSDQFPEEELSECINDGDSIAQMCYGNQKWVLLTEKKKSLS